MSKYKTSLSNIFLLSIAAGLGCLVSTFAYATNSATFSVQGTQPATMSKWRYYVKFASAHSPIYRYPASGQYLSGTSFSTSLLTKAFAEPLEPYHGWHYRLYYNVPADITLYNLPNIVQCTTTTDAQVKLLCVTNSARGGYCHAITHLSSGSSYIDGFWTTKGYSQKLTITLTGNGPNTKPAFNLACTANKFKS